MNKFKIILFSIFFIICKQSFAQVITLDSVLILIEKNNPMLKMYDEQINAANNNAQGAKSWMAPSISTGPWQTPYKNFNEGMWMITAEQMIPNPKKQRSNFDYIKGMSNVELQGKNVKKNELFAMAKLLYSNWIVSKKKYVILQETDSLLNYLVKVANIRYTYNKEKLNNIYKAQAELFQLRNMETMIFSDMEMIKIELRTLMSLDKNSSIELDTLLVPKYYELQFSDTTLISTSRSDVKQFKESIGLIRMQQQYEKSKRLPDFGISLSHMQSLGEMPNSYSAMGMITIPIAPWASKEYKSNIKGLDNAANAIIFEEQALINESTGKILSLQTQIKSSKILISNYDNNILPAYLNSYHTTLIAYEQNTEDLFVVLDGLKMYWMAKIESLDQLFNLLKLQTEYEKELEIR
jgi:outer membrane protein TolC